MQCWVYVQLFKRHILTLRSKTIQQTLERQTDHNAGKNPLKTACLGGKVWCNYLYYATQMDQLEI